MLTCRVRKTSIFYSVCTSPRVILVSQLHNLVTRSIWLSAHVVLLVHTMRKSFLLIVVCALVGTFAQNDEYDKAISDIFTTPNTNFFNQYDEVTTPKSNGFGAVDKCGEGKDKGIHMCVRYHNCDGETKTIISSADYDGTGSIDIRFGSNSCDHYLDVCCKIPDNGVLPPEVTPAPDGGDGVTPREPDIPTPPPIDDNVPNLCGIRNENGVDFKITGNSDNEAEFGEFPWMLAILNQNPTESNLVCGGSLIAFDVVLTSAHCVHKLKTSDIKVRAGEWDTQTERERYAYQERGVRQIIVHDDFSSNNLFNDVALLILERPFKRAQHIATICLPQRGQVFNSRECFASGWGKDIFGQKGRYQVILKKIQLPTVPKEHCQEALRKTRLGKNFKLHESFVCAGGENGKDTCTGDGGSPLVCPDPNNPKRYMQAGAVAWGIGCGEQNVPGVYANTAFFRDWIDQHLARLNVDKSSYTV